jgi:hypothetical protein
MSSMVAILQKRELNDCRIKTRTGENPLIFDILYVMIVNIRPRATSWYRLTEVGELCGLWRGALHEGGKVC